MDINKEELPKQKTFWTKFSHRIILALALLLPLWFLPFGGNALGISKSILILVAVLFASVFYFVHILQKGSVKYFSGIAVWSLVAVLVSTLVSSFFSQAMSVSFFGVGGETGTFAFIFASSLAFFLTALLFQSEKRVLALFSFLIVSSLVVFIIEALRIIFDLNFFGFVSGGKVSLVGSLNELAIFFGFIGLIAVVSIEFFKKTSRGWRVMLYVIMALSLLSVALINFTTAWYVLGFLFLVLFIYLFSFSGKARNFVYLSLFLVLISLFFILIRPLMGDLTNALGFESLDVRPSWSATFQINKSVLTESVKNMILGSGPNTFAYDWAKFKPVSINETIFWNVGFQSGIGLLPSFVATTGVFASIFWLFFVLSILYYGFRAVLYTEDNIIRSLLFGSFLGSVYLWVFNIIYTPGNFLFFLSFLVTGLFFAMLIKSGKLPMKEFSFGDKVGLNFIFSLAIVLVLILSVAGFYLLFQKYWAAYSYARGVDLANSGADLDTVQNLFSKAASFDQQPRYHQMLSDIGLVRLSQISTDNLSEDEAILQFQNVLAFTIEQAQMATTLNPEDSSNWIALGGVYENLIPYKLEGADQVALEAYKKALEKAPSSPYPLLLSARVHAQMGRNDEARSFIDSALALKSNYTSARFLLAQIAAQEGDLEDAIKQTELARLTAPSDTGVLFQLGMLYYQNKDYKKAQLVFEGVIKNNPNYSNARYFLGLIYSELNNDSAAIEQFEKIEALNPGNTEVGMILSNLRAGRSPLSNISPPELAPEERGELPIDEETSMEEE
ncbi:tetratricopeptide repeat protein [Patescibacteria group bacterium]|nr:tetratricopeptide repeat protein [Patescibacteria group bacterium]